MRRFLILVAAICLLSFARAAAEESDPIGVAQRLFDAMSDHDAEAARALFTSEATLLTVRPDQTAVSVPHEKWLEHLGTSKDKWLERMWNPKVLAHGAIATVQKFTLRPSFWGFQRFPSRFSWCDDFIIEIVETRLECLRLGPRFNYSATTCGSGGKAVSMSP